MSHLPLKCPQDHFQSYSYFEDMSKHKAHKAIIKFYKLKSGIKWVNASQSSTIHVIKELFLKV